MNRFSEGQRVVCISEDFPIIEKWSTGKETNNKPKKGEILVIDEILGDFLMFNKYSSVNNINWWKYDRFAPVDETKSAVIANAVKQSVN
jgi:hypothetical protein